MIKKTLFLFTALFASQVMANDAIQQAQATTENLLKNAAENVQPAFTTAPKQSDLPALNYVNQPPMVPHAVKNYQVTKNVNQCLACHSPENARVTGATRISPTHFADRNGNIGSSSSPRRYFCLQCHVSQSDVEPIVPNQFKPEAGYGN